MRLASSRFARSATQTLRRSMTHGLCEVGVWLLGMTHQPSPAATAATGSAATDAVLAIAVIGAAAPGPLTGTTTSVLLHPPAQGHSHASAEMAALQRTSSSHAVTLCVVKQTLLLVLQ